jgi:hypothetical protein
VAPVVVPDAPPPADALLPAAALVALYLVLVPDDCLLAPVDAEAGWPALAVLAASFQLVVAQVVPVVTPQQVRELRFAVVLEPPCARLVLECVPVQETRVEAEAAWSQPPADSLPLRAALQ